MTQLQLAEALGLSKSAISQFESGNSGPSMETLTKLEKLFGEFFTVGFPEEEETINDRRRRNRDNGSLLLRIDFEALYVELPFIPRDGYQEFVEQRHLDAATPQEVEWVWILRMENADYANAAILEIQGNRMLPRYPENSRYLIRIVAVDDWSYATGVHLLALKGGKTLLRRIASNDSVALQLVSDSSEERIQVLLSDVDFMWKLGEAVYLPSEDQ
jgi:transcriptional regulator with XRE-family HTH domain